VIQLALLRAVQPQPAIAVTLTNPLVAAAPTERLLDETVKVQVAPACVRVNVLSSMVMCPTRELLVMLAVTE
jgi:hypothetical protein